MAPLLMALVMCGAATAETPHDSVSTLTLQEAERQAIAHQPALVSARYEKEAATAVAKQARSIELPQVAAAAELFGATENNPAVSYLAAPDFARVGTRPAPESQLNEWTPFVSSLVGVGAHYDVVDFGYTRGTVGSAESNQAAVTQLESQALQDVLLRVDEAYFRALAAEQQLAVAKDSLIRAQEHDDLAQAGVKSQLKPQIDLARSQAELAAGQLEVIRAQNSVQVAHASLDTAIGWNPPTGYVLVAPPQNSSPVPEEAAASEAAFATRFDLTAIYSQEKAVQYSRLAAESGNYPRLIATSSLSLRGFDALPVTPDWDVGLVLTFPLFTGFNVQGQIEEQDAREADLQAREIALKQGIAYQIRQARETLLSARQAEVASEAQVTAASTNARLAEGRYREGLGTIVDLTDAQAELDVAQSGLVQSHLAESVSRVQLEYAMGALRPPP